MHDEHDTHDHELLLTLLGSAIALALLIALGNLGPDLLLAVLS